MTSPVRVEEQYISRREADTLMLALSLIDQVLPGETLALVRQLDGFMHVTPAPDIDPGLLMDQLAKADWLGVARLVKMQSVRRSK